jgi:uncharacterized repeat protein (TIGR02543 family)
MNQNHTVSASFAIDTFVLTVTTTGSGTVSFGSVTSCSGTCQATFNYGDTPAVTQSAAMGYRFFGWGGACTGTGTCAPQITGTTNVSATFTQQVQLSLSLGMGGGTLAPTTAANSSCGAGCYNYDVNTSVTVAATPTSPGATIGAWGGACAAVAAGASSCVVAMGTSNKSASVTFMQTLTVSPQPTNGTISGGGLSCPGGLCQTAVAYGTPVTLTATGAPHYHLSAWGGDGTCTGTNPCAPTMTANHTVTASFALDQYTLTVTVVGGGTVSFGSVSSCSGPTCSGTFNYGDAPSVTQSAGPGYRFTGWSGACSGTGACMPTISGNTNVTATFTQQVQLTWSVSSNGGGSVAPSPAANSSCGAGCGNYDINASVTLNTTTSNGSTVGAWGGDCATNAFGAASCVVAMGTSNKAATVAFQYQVTWSNGAGGGTVAVMSATSGGTSCGGSCMKYNAGTTVTFSETPQDASSTIGGWSGCTPSPAATTCAVTLGSGNASVTATFQYTLTVSTTANPAGNNGGRVYSSDGVINCSSASGCVYHINYGISYALFVQPTSYWQFTGWGPSGLCTGTGGCGVTGAGSVVANFSWTQYTLTVTAGMFGTTSVDGVQGACATGCTYYGGTSHTVTATPNVQYFTFWQWKGTNLPFSAASGTFAIGNNVSMWADFSVPLITLWSNGIRGIDSSGNNISGGGTMTLKGFQNETSDTGLRSVTYICNADSPDPTACQPSGGGWGFDKGRQITVTATPDSSWRIASWYGIGAGVPNTVTTWYISNFGATNQGINWCEQSSGSLCFWWHYSDVDGNRVDLVVPYQYPTNSVGILFQWLVG